MKSYIYVLTIMLLPVVAASQFVKPSTKTLQSLDSLQLEKYHLIDSAKGESFVSYNFVEFENFASQNTNGRFAIRTGYQDCSGLSMICTYIEYVDSANYLIIAEIIDDDTTSPCGVGSAVIVMDSGIVYTELNYNNKFFTLFDLGSNTGLLAELDTNLFGCEVLLGEGANFFSSFNLFNSSTLPMALSEECDDNEVDLVVFYTLRHKLTTKITSRVRVSALVNACIQYFNSAQKRSSTTGSYAKLKLKHLALLLPFDETAYLDNTGLLESFYTNPTVIDARNQYYGDLAFLITNSKKQNELTNSNGAGFLEPNAMPALKFRAVAYMNAYTSGIRVFAHEIGHNLGADHLSHSVWIPSTEANRAKLTPKNKGTIMANTGNPIPYFSNPNIKVDKEFIGDYGFRYNQYYIEANATDVANYYYPIGQAHRFLYIKAPGFSCPYEYVTASLCYENWNISSISWFTSYDGINWSSFSDGPTTYIDMPGTPNTMLYLKAECETYVLGLGWTTLSYFHTIQISSAVNGLPCTLKRNEFANELSDVQKANIVLFPVPCQDFAFLEVLNSTLFNNDLLIEVFDSQMKLLLRMDNIRVTENNSLIQLKIDDFSSGQYFIRLIGRKETYFLKLVKL